VKILFYFNDFTDTSEHFHRLVSICDYLRLRPLDHSILIVSGSELLISLSISRNLTYLELPSLAQEFQGPSEGVSCNVERIALRSQMIVEVIHDFKPDIVLVDELPCGIGGELRVTISTLKSEYTDTKLFLLLRDVIDHPESIIPDWEDQGFYRTIEQDYDQVLILGMQEIFHAPREYQFSAAIYHKVVFCGYIRHHAEYQHIPSVRQSLKMRQTDQLVVVAPTGDYLGYQITANYLQGLALLPNENNIKTAIFLSPDLSPRRRQTLLNVAELNDRVIIQKNRNDLMRYMVSANAVVTTGGYDRICEVFSAGAPAVIIPKTISSCEELIRIANMRKLGLLKALHPEKLTPHTLMELVWKQLQQDPFKPRLGLDLEALPRISQYLEQVANTTTRPNSTVKHDRRRNPDRRANHNSFANSIDVFSCFQRSENPDWGQNSSGLNSTYAS
jgi:predicted glycosyltransferase